MPSYLLKPSPDADFYVYWSTVVEAPVAWGDRSLLEGEYPKGELTPERFERADSTGSSALDRHMDWGQSWIYEQRGLIGHGNLTDLCFRLAHEEPVDDLLEPFDD